MSRPPNLHRHTCCASPTIPMYLSDNWRSEFTEKWTTPALDIRLLGDCDDQSQDNHAVRGSLPASLYTLLQLSSLKRTDLRELSHEVKGRDLVVFGSECCLVSSGYSTDLLILWKDMSLFDTVRSTQ